MNTRVILRLQDGAENRTNGRGNICNHRGGHCALRRDQHSRPASHGTRESYVAQINANTWAISARGLNGRFSNELLVIVDGRNVYTPTFGGVLWYTLDLPLENIERIEVIRGPGLRSGERSAVNGVINIITKKAAQAQGGRAGRGGAGESGIFRDSAWLSLEAGWAKTRATGFLPNISTRTICRPRVGRLDLTAGAYSAAVFGWIVTCLKKTISRSRVICTPGRRILPERFFPRLHLPGLRIVISGSRSPVVF